MKKSSNTAQGNFLFSTGGVNASRTLINDYAEDGPCRLGVEGGILGYVGYGKDARTDVEETQCTSRASIQLWRYEQEIDRRAVCYNYISKTDEAKRVGQGATAISLREDEGDRRGLPFPLGDGV